MAQLSYQSAGVDLALYDQAMQRLPALMKQTHTPRVIPVNDAFGGLFRLNTGKRGGPPTYRDPVLVSGTDGVGTKLKVAIATQLYSTVGIDLVAMSVNDVICMGADPLFFLDYLALGKDNPDLIATLVAGVAKGCQESGVALLGGETAIMPDLYAEGDFDMAGFCVGVVERTEMITGSAIRPGDVLLALPSSGFHSNGYSLVRKAVFEHAGLTTSDHVPELGTNVGAALLAPTRLYAPAVRRSLKRYKANKSITGLAHITGGGLKDNVERFLQDDVRVVIDRNAWQPHPVFPWLQRLGNIDREEMYHTFNMGIGFVFIVRPRFASGLKALLEQHGETVHSIGHVVAGHKGVVYQN